MTTIVRWQPFTELMSLRQAMDRLFEDSFFRPFRFGTRPAEDRLSLNMYQTRDDVVVEAALPGVKPDEVEISVTGDTLTIRGEHKEEQETNDEDYLYKEYRHGTFSRSVTIPVPVESDKAEAVFEDGILTLTLPKVEEVRPKQIKVKTRAKAKEITEGKK